MPWYQNYRTWIIILSIATAICAIGIAILQNFETERQNKLDDLKDEEVKKALKSNLDSTVTLLELTNQLNDSHQEYIKLQKRLEKFVTGGDNIPLFYYGSRFRTNEINERNEISIRFFLENTGDVPISNISIEVFDHVNFSIDPKSEDIAPNSEKPKYEKFFYPVLPPELTEEFYSTVFDVTIRDSYYFEFFVKWNANFYKLETVFDLKPIQGYPTCVLTEVRILKNGEPVKNPSRYIYDFYKGKSDE